MIYSYCIITKYLNTLMRMCNMEEWHRYDGSGAVYLLWNVHSIDVSRLAREVDWGNKHGDY